MNELRKIVAAIAKDSAYISAQFVRADGEVVIGDYKLIGWTRAPTAERDDTNDRLRLPPLTVVETKPR